MEKVFNKIIIKGGDTVSANDSRISDPNFRVKLGTTGYIVFEDNSDESAWSRVGIKSSGIEHESDVHFMAADGTRSSIGCKELASGATGIKIAAENDEGSQLAVGFGTAAMFVYEGHYYKETAGIELDVFGHGRCILPFGTAVTSSGDNIEFWPQADAMGYYYRIDVMIGSEKVGYIQLNN